MNPAVSFRSCTAVPGMWMPQPLGTPHELRLAAFWIASIVG